jgi:mono/diheme cytochrome c family protein
VAAYVTDPLVIASRCASLSMIFGSACADCHGSTQAVYSSIGAGRTTFGWRKVPTQRLRHLVDEVVLAEWHE